MRIAGGKYKGRLFNPGKKFRSRPTTDLAKEALFNILENRYNLKTKKVLDLFSGTGSMGYEFASRGAKELVMVEKNYNHFKFIQDTVKMLDIGNSRTIKGDAFVFLKKTSEKFDIVFADPPFDLDKLNDIPDLVFTSNVLNAEGVFILEHSKGHNFTNHPNYIETRHYGKVNFSFFA
ncbi:MAG: 16S rRNA (guanine(966)-N(2))-methyltransferase RsmD [Prolixibacteraceae bacterium]